MDIVQSFYNDLARDYDKLFQDWDSSINEQAVILDKLFKDNKIDKTSNILDCACGIGTQTIGLGKLGYNITASDVSVNAIEEAKLRAQKNNLNVEFKVADFRALEKTFSTKFNAVIAMDNALPHALTKSDLTLAVKSIVSTLKPNGVFIASIRDYDEILKEKPTLTKPYVHKTEKGQRISFQTWMWKGENYNLIQYIIEDEDNLKISKFECEYRATTKGELSSLFTSLGCTATWKFESETGFYQPIIIAKKQEV